MDHPIFSELEIREWIRKGWKTKARSFANRNRTYYDHESTYGPRGGVEPHYQLNADLTVDFLEQVWGVDRSSAVCVYRLPAIPTLLEPHNPNALDISKIAIQVEEIIVLPFKVRSSHGSFSCSGLGLTSLVGAPDIVQDSFDCSFNQLTSLDWAPSVVYRDFSCQGNPKLISLHNIHKHIKLLNGKLVIGPQVNNSLLGTLKIQGLTYITIDDIPNPLITEESERLLRAVRIINKHLELDKDIHLCQEELLETGLSAFARL